MLLGHKRAIAIFSYSIALASCDSDDEPARRDPGTEPSSGSGGALNVPRSTGGSAGTLGQLAGAGGDLGEAGSAGSDGGTSATAGTSGTAGTSSAGSAGSAADAPLALPFVVDEYYAASGGMGDASIAGPVTQTPDINCLPRPSDAVGRCWKTSYEPDQNGWAGFYWQYPVNNWGDRPGLRIAAGATQVTFYAASNLEGLKVQFLVGGINDPTMPAHDPSLYFDPYAVKYVPEQGLTTELTRYTIALPETSEAVRIIGAFGWTIGASDPGQIPIPEGQSIELYLDGIEWQ